jgi:DNA-binding GntR family transcriptional regulator
MAQPIDRMSKVAIFLQVANDLDRRVRAKEWKQGNPIPAEARLAVEYAVGRDTVRRALRELESRGLVVTLAARGTFVK